MKHIYFLGNKQVFEHNVIKHGMRKIMLFCTENKHLAKKVSRNKKVIFDRFQSLIIQPSSSEE